MHIPLPNVAKLLSLSSQFPYSTSTSGNTISKNVPSMMAEIPGGSPFSLCEVSRPTDLFQISLLQVSKQPIYIDDDFMVHFYGTFQKNITHNATMAVNGNCGSHCDDYGVDDPKDRLGATWTTKFCDMSDIEQPLGGRKAGCPPEKGDAMVHSVGYIWPMLINVPGWYNFSIDAKTKEGERIYCITTEVCLRWADEDKNWDNHPGPWTNCSWPR